MATMTITHDGPEGGRQEHLVLPEPGDVPNSALGIGFDVEELERQAELEELAEAELQDRTTATGLFLLPDEDPDEPEPPATRTAPASWQKILRVFAFAFAGSFLTALLPILSTLASGQTTDFSVGASLLVGAIAGALAAGIRGVVALSPFFADDDDDGMKRVSS